MHVHSICVLHRSVQCVTSAVISKRRIGTTYWVVVCVCVCVCVCRCTDDFNGAQLKAVCVEAGMIALRRKAEELSHEDYMDGKWGGVVFRDMHDLSLSLSLSLGILEVQAKKKTNLVYYA